MAQLLLGLLPAQGQCVLSFTAFLRHNSEQGTLLLFLSLCAPHCCPLALGDVCMVRGVLGGQFFLQAPGFGQMLYVFGQKGLYLDAREKEQWRAPPSQKSTQRLVERVCAEEAAIALQ